MTFASPAGAAIIATAIVFGLLFAALLALVLFGISRTTAVETSPNQAVFTSGTVPHQLPDGFYKGSVSSSVPKGTWQGKVFSATSATGTNQFQGTKRYHFKVYPAMGLRDENTHVLRIDYRQPGNPWWLGFIVDEIVLTEPGQYLGKVHFHFAGATFTLAYFTLQK